MNGTCRFTILIHINKLPQKYIYQHAKIVGVKILRRAFGSEQKIQYFEHEELHAQILSRTIYMIHVPISHSAKVQYFTYWLD